MKEVKDLIMILNFKRQFLNVGSQVLGLMDLICCFILREKSLSAFPVQVRITYFGLLFLAQAPFMFWIFWWQLIGTSAMVFFEYCFLARCLSLLPWNKQENYSLELIKSTFLSGPVKGNILQGLPGITG